MEYNKNNINKKHFLASIRHGERNDLAKESRNNEKLGKTVDPELTPAGLQ